jgi:N-acetylmuramic acid 6-phosphate (MurNAc-6-P) etherase
LHLSDLFARAQLVALKMLLNAHSTAVMAGLGRLVGNTMTNVSPSNLKLIGRATNLIRNQC